MKFRQRIKIIINLVIVLMVAYAWISMFFGEDGILLRKGFQSLKYYTLLSNIFVGIVSGVYLKSLAAGHVSKSVFLWKYIGTVAVFLTFFVVIAFLGPRFGYSSMFLGGNLFMHLIVPLIVLIEFIFLDRDHQISLRETTLAIVPMLVYGMFYLGNILINGVGEGKDTNDLYGFTTWGIPIGIGIFLILIVIDWILAALIRFGNLSAGKLMKRPEASG